MSSKHETCPFVVVVMPFYINSDCRFLCQVSLIICISGMLFLVRHVTIVSR